MAQLAHGKQRGSGRDFGVQETEEIGTRPYVKPLDSLAFLAILETATTRLRLLPLAVPVRAIPAFSMRIPRKREGASPWEFLAHLLRRHRPPRALAGAESALTSVRRGVLSRDPCGGGRRSRDSAPSGLAREARDPVGGSDYRAWRRSREPRPAVAVSVRRVPAAGPSRRRERI